MGGDLVMEKKRLRIAFLNITQGTVERGAEVFVKELSERLSEKYEVKVMAGGRRMPRRWPVLWRFYLDPAGLKILWWSMAQVPRLLRMRFEVVVPVNGGWQVALVRMATWVYGGKMVISGQSGIGWDDRNNLWSFPDCFVAISAKAEKWARKVNSLVKVKYIPNGVDLNKFKPEGRRMKTDLEGKVVLCVGALVESKRIELVIKAVARLEGVSLLVVGEGLERKKIETMGDELLGKRFKLVKVAHEKMPEAYRAANVFCLVPEPREAFGVVFVEAMATGKPVVTINDEIRKVIVGEAGILVDRVGEAGELSEAIARALAVSWGEKPRKQASKFSWEKVAGEYEKLCQSLVNNT